MLTILRPQHSSSAVVYDSTGPTERLMIMTFVLRLPLPLYIAFPVVEPPAIHPSTHPDAVVVHQYTHKEVVVCRPHLISIEMYSGISRM